MWYPLINSDSPSAKSKGARLASITQHSHSKLTNRKTDLMGMELIPKNEYRWNATINRGNIITSYLSVRITIRILPKLAYWLLDIAPATNNGRLDTLKSINTPKQDNGLYQQLPGIMYNRVAPIINVSIPGSNNHNFLLPTGRINCLAISLIPSNRGWMTPIKPTFAAPLRICAPPSTKRSTRVSQPTLIRAQTNTINKLITDSKFTRSSLLILSQSHILCHTGSWLYFTGCSRTWPSLYQPWSVSVHDGLLPR